MQQKQFITWGEQQEQEEIKKVELVRQLKKNSLAYIIQFSMLPSNN